MFQYSTDGLFTNSFKGKGRRPIYSLENVSVAFGHIQALENICLKIEEGEIVFVTGVSGAGKTSLLRVLAGEQIVSGGEVKGKNHGLVAQIFQDLRLMPQHSCEKNLLQAYDRNIYSSKEQFYRELGELAQVLDFKDHLQLKITHANGGLKQKIAFARAILSRPNVILADEPTASLDYDNARKLYDIMSIYNLKRNLTVIWASHNRDLIKKFNGRILYLERGKLISGGNLSFT